MLSKSILFNSIFLRSFVLLFVCSISSISVWGVGLGWLVCGSYLTKYFTLCGKLSDDKSFLREKGTCNVDGQCGEIKCNELVAAKKFTPEQIAKAFYKFGVEECDNTHEKIFTDLSKSEDVTRINSTTMPTGNVTVDYMPTYPVTEYVSDSTPQLYNILTGSRGLSTNGLEGDDEDYAKYYIAVGATAVVSAATGVALLVDHMCFEGRGRRCVWNGIKQLGNSCYSGGARLQAFCCGSKNSVANPNVFYIGDSTDAYPDSTIIGIDADCNPDVITETGTSDVASDTVPLIKKNYSAKATYPDSDQPTDTEAESDGSLPVTNTNDTVPLVGQEYGMASTEITTLYQK